jgi:inosose dehydratase
MTATTRRQFLNRATTFSGSAWLSTRTSAATRQPADITLGFSLYGMKTLRPADALRACSRIGYDAVEISLMPGWPTEPKRLTIDDRRTLRKQLNELGLTLPAVMENLILVVDDARHAINRDRLKTAAELAHDLSPDRAPVIETILGGRPDQWEHIKNQMVDRLGAWAEVAAAAKIVIAIKAHVGGAVHTPEAAQWLRRQVDHPSIRLVYDYSHFALRRLSLADTLRTMLTDTVFIHVKDARGDAKHVKFLLPGQGDVDYVDYFKRIKAAGYRGCVAVEVSGQIHGRPGYDAIDAATQSYAHLAPAMENAGITRRRSPTRPNRP